MLVAAVKAIAAQSPALKDPDKGEARSLAVFPLVARRHSGLPSFRTIFCLYDADCNSYFLHQSIVVRYTLFYGYLIILSVFPWGISFGRTNVYPTVTFFGTMFEGSSPFLGHFLPRTLDPCLSFMS